MKAELKIGMQRMFGAALVVKPGRKWRSVEFSALIGVVLVQFEIGV